MGQVTLELGLFSLVILWATQVNHLVLVVEVQLSLDIDTARLKITVISPGEPSTWSHLDNFVNLVQDTLEGLILSSHPQGVEHLHCAH